MIPETLAVKKGQGSVALVDSRLKCMSQTIARSFEHYPQTSIRVGDLNLLSSEKEMVIKKELL
jgi:hypothetical protein